jgi:hypothetical protein
MNQAQLLEDLTAVYDETGLRELCQTLHVNYAYLVGVTLRDKMMALMRFLERRERLPELVELLVRERPYLAPNYSDIPTPEPALSSFDNNLNWLDDLAMGGGTALEELPTLQWSEDNPAVPAPIRDEEEMARQYDLAPTSLPPATSKPIAAEHLPAYDTSQPVRQPHMFFGREQARQQIHNRLLNLDSSAIVGLRHSGKSSLLYFLSHHEYWPSDQPFLFAYLDLDETVYHTCAGLLNGALQQWERATDRLVKAAPNRSFPPIDNLLTSTVTDLNDFAHRVQSLSTAGYNLVLCLDGMAQLVERPSEFSDPLFNSWYALSQSGYLAFVTASQRPLTDLFAHANLDGRFPSLFHPINLGLLTTDAATDLINDPNARHNIVIPAAAIQQLLDLCGRHPFYLQMAAAYLAHDLLVSGRYQPEQLAARFSRAAEAHWRGLWQSLSPLAQTVLSLPLKTKAPAAILREYKALAEMGVLVAENGRYHHFSQGFADWVHEEAKSQNLLQKLREYLAKESDQ